MMQPLCDHLASLCAQCDDGFATTTRDTCVVNGQCFGCPPLDTPCASINDITIQLLGSQVRSNLLFMFLSFDANTEKTQVCGTVAVQSSGAFRVTSWNAATLTEGAKSVDLTLFSGASYDCVPSVVGSLRTLTCPGGDTMQFSGIDGVAACFVRFIKAGGGAPIEFAARFKFPVTAQIVQTTNVVSGLRACSFSPVSSVDDF